MSLFEGFAIEVIYNRKGNAIAEMHILPFENVRAGKTDRYGNVDCYYYNTEWERKPTSYETIPAFNPKKVMKANKLDQPKQLLYIAMPSNLSQTYPVPSYSSAINYIATEYELSKHTLSSVVNNFLPSSLITFIGNPTTEERALNKKLFTNNFTGSEASAKIIIN